MIATMLISLLTIGIGVVLLTRDSSIVAVLGGVLVLAGTWFLIPIVFSLLDTKLGVVFPSWVPRVLILVSLLGVSGKLAIRKKTLPVIAGVIGVVIAVLVGLPLLDGLELSGTAADIWQNFTTTFSGLWDTANQNLE